MQSGANIVQPSIEFMQDWASGLVDIKDTIVACEYVNWSYAYLGFESPDFKAGDNITNQAIANLTVASRLRLSELGYEW